MKPPPPGQITGTLMIDDCGMVCPSVRRILIAGLTRHLFFCGSYDSMMPGMEIKIVLSN